jgi:hypothetical protein
MSATGKLNYWYQGEPIILQEGLGGLQYWFEGLPFVFMGAESIEAKSEGWFEGQPVDFFSDLESLDIWFQGSPFVYLESKEPSGGIQIVDNAIRRIMLVPATEPPPFDFSIWGGGVPIIPQRGTGGMDYWGGGAPLTNLD